MVKYVMVINLRLYKLIKLNGYTKSEMNALNEKKLITVNGKILNLSSFINEDDIILVDNKRILMPKFHYFLYYKPKGIESTISDKKESYIKNINIDFKVMVAGRLDKESFGLMILSNDGDFINTIQTSNDYKKTYIVEFEKEINDSFLSGFDKEYIIRGRKTSKIYYEVINKNTLKLILNEGVYHEIRHITKLNGNRVTNLKRIKIGKYELGDMTEGEIKEVER